MESIPEIKKKPFYKKLLRFFIWSAVLFLLIAGSLIALLLVYENEVKAAIVAELNKHLKAEVKINPKNIDLTIIKTFPDCSIEFKNALMLEALPKQSKRDTLLFAERLNLHFNIQNLWNKKYDIEKIKIKNAVVKLQELKNGKNNYTFWESSEGVENTDISNGVVFNLNLITLENCRLSYENNSSDFKTKLLVKNLEFKGHFKQTQFDLNTKSSAEIFYITQGKSTFLKNKNLNFAFDLDVNQNKYTFKQTSLNLNRLALELNGGFVYNKKFEQINIDFNAPNLEIASLLSLLPESFTNNFRDYESTGNFYAQGNFTYSGKNKYKLTSAFGIKNGNITYKPEAAEARSVNAEGNLLLSNSSSLLDIKNISLSLEEDEIKGQCLINDFSNPYLSVTAQANVHLENLIKFFPIDTLEFLKGEVKLNSNIEGLLSDLKNQTFSNKVKLELETSLSALQVQFKGDEKLYSVENCSLAAKNRNIEVHDLILKRGKSDVKVNGKIPELFNYLFDKSSPLIIHGSLVSEQVHLEDFIPKYSSSSSKTSNSPLIPANIQLLLSAEIAHFSFAKFEATNIIGDIEIKNQKAIINNMTLKTMQGEAEISAFADNSKNKLDVVLQSNLKNINISDLFFECENFGQTTLQDKNLKGIASANLDFSGTWSNELEANYNSIKADCNLNIVRGELIDFKPLLSLSKFVNIEDLKHIRFSDLQSSVNIANGVISVPKTSIKNSALNIDFYGTHAFDDKIDYHFGLLISELLAKKRKHKNDDEFGVVENDRENRRSAFIRMTGTLDKPVFKYDRRSLKEKTKSDIKTEKQNIRQILKEEFGLFKKDTVQKKNKQQEQIFELEKPNDNLPKKNVKDDDEDF